MICLNLDIFGVWKVVGHLNWCIHYIAKKNNTYDVWCFRDFFHHAQWWNLRVFIGTPVPDSCNHECGYLQHDVDNYYGWHTLWNKLLQFAMWKMMAHFIGCFIYLLIVVILQNYVKWPWGNHQPVGRANASIFLWHPFFRNERCHLQELKTHQISW